jgi:hypothetical protein
MDNLLIYYGGEIPKTAGGFLGGISGGEIEKIIRELDGTIDPHDEPLETFTPTLEYVEIETRKKKHNSDNESESRLVPDESGLVPDESESIIVDAEPEPEPESIIVDAESESGPEQEPESIIVDAEQEEPEPKPKAKTKVGGVNNVLKVLIGLIPSVFPKQYL